MERRLITGHSPFEASAGFSRAVVAGDVVYVSGTAPIPPGGTPAPTGAYDQARMCLVLIGEALERAGSSLAHVVRTRMFITDAADWPEIARAHGETFADIRPAATAVVVAELLDPAWKIEIEADAIAPAPRDDVMLGPGDQVPAASIWPVAGEPPVSLREILRARASLLCFYPFDWSPTCTNELLVLERRRVDLMAAGVEPIGISRDSAWSHRAFAEALGIGLPLLSDANGEAARGFGIATDRFGIHDAAERAAFLIDRDATVRASWLLGADLPDVDVAIAAASSLLR